MPVLDLEAIKEEMTPLQQIVEGRFGGAENIHGFKDLSEQEKADALPAVTIYEEWRDAVSQFLDAVTKLIALGYPDLPTFPVSPAMIATITREYAETGKAIPLFVPRPLATKASVTFSAPQDK